MPSQWDRLCAILDLAEKLPTKDRTIYLQSAFMALAYESRINMTTRDLKIMHSKMEKKTNGHMPRKKRRASI